MGCRQSNAPPREELFWAFCRILAQETRLRLLGEIIGHSRLCVYELAHRVGISETNASIHLKTLHGGGLIAPYRKKQQVFYSAEAPSTARFATEILPVLGKTIKAKTPLDKIIHQLTAFTHQRRIEVIRVLSAGPKTFDELMEATSITFSALHRHLCKLKSRGFVIQSESSYYISCPDTLLARALLDASLLLLA